MGSIWKPHGYQRRAADFLVKRPYAGLLLFPGLGKTSISLEAFCRIRGLTDQSLSALVVGPLRPIYSVWPAEVEKWDNFKHLSYKILHGKDKDDLLRIPTDLTFTNFDSLRWLISQPYGEWPWDILIVDESGFVKRPSSYRFKYLKSVLNRFKYRYILTGSPASKNLLDLFGQLYIMDAGQTLGKYITHYREEYFHRAGYQGYKWELNPGADKLIYERIAPRVLSMNSEDYLALPPISYRNLYVDLPDGAHELYKTMEKKLFTDLDTGEVVAVNAGVRSMMCRQIASGNLYEEIDGKKQGRHIHDEKENLLVELVNELEGQPTIVAYQFKHELERLKLLFKDAPVIGGGISAQETDRILRKWNKGEIPVLLGHPQSMGHGLNMQESGRAVIWYSLPWSQDHYSQLNQRIWRQGQKNPVFIYHLLARKTIDEAIIKSLNRKTRTQNQLFKALKEYRLAH